MRLLDLYPRKGTFKPGEAILLEATIEAAQAEEGELRLTCTHLAEEQKSFRVPLAAQPGRHSLPISVNLSSIETKGYGVHAELVDGQGRSAGSATTAFDVLESWLAFPRYGFLTDFDPGTSEPAALDMLARFHINGLQFYDWHYRHDHLLPPTETYIDPLGRALSLETVRERICQAHEHGMAAMAYAAVYAASLPFAQQHPGWRLYDQDGQPILFEDFLGLMDPSADSPWVSHLVKQCERALSELPFDGLHIDQYGEPKVGYNARGEPVDIPAAFQDFIHLLKQRFSGSSVTFNAVGNWPIEALTAAPLDFVYIEIWPATPSYQDVLDIVLSAREKSNGKPVVVALYIPVEHVANILLTDALIFASGGSRIELGEHARLLADPYFPKHQALTPDLNAALSRYYDFAVRYGEFIGPSATRIEIEGLSTREGVWLIPRRNEKWLILHLINMTDLVEASWCEVHSTPSGLQDVSISWPIKEGVRNVWWASPDGEQMALREASWRVDKGRIQVTIPTLDYWAMIALETENDTV